MIICTILDESWPRDMHDAAVHQKQVIQCHISSTDDNYCLYLCSWYLFGKLRPFDRL